MIEAMLSLRIGIVGDCGVGKSALSMKICSLGSMSEIGVNLPFYSPIVLFIVLLMYIRCVIATGIL
jgi:hypothetical protein